MRGAEHGHGRRKLRTEEVEPFEAMKWVLTHKVGDDETYLHRSYREWLKESRAAFMADFARREREQAEKLPKPMAPAAETVVPLVPEEDLGGERSLKVLERWLEGHHAGTRRLEPEDTAGVAREHSLAGGDVEGDEDGQGTS